MLHDQTVAAMDKLVQVVGRGLKKSARRSEACRCPLCFDGPGCKLHQSPSMLPDHVPREEGSLEHIPHTTHAAQPRHLSKVPQEVQGDQPHHKRIRSHAELAVHSYLLGQVFLGNGAPY